MNEIEQKFYDAYIDEYVNPENDICCTQEIKSQIVVGIYKVDFIINDKYIIEIDGHEYHKTKEQREQDYKRERYLIKKGFIVIRFMGTEIFLSSTSCAKEVLKLVDDLSMTADHDDAVSCSNYHDFMKNLEDKRRSDIRE